MAEVTIEDIKKVSFKKGDVMVIKAPLILNDNQYNEIIQRCAKILPKGVSLLILDNGKEITILGKEEK